MKIQAYASPKPKSKLEPFTYEPKSLGPHDVQIKITHCGICHSDVHIIDNDWQIGFYPAVPGHEIVGLIEERGSEVSHVNVGDRVGVGWQRSSCLQCDQCLSGNEQFCERQEATCAGHYGGYADRIRLDGRFAFKIPDGMKSEVAAPLLCGGVTVYSPFEHVPIRPDHRVAVIGMGGLGHMAIKMAHHWGCDVTAFSTTPEKEQEAHEMGADHFFATKNPSELKDLRKSFDVILSTAPVDLDWAAYVKMLKPNGTLCLVGASPGTFQGVHVFDLITGTLSIKGSNIGSRQTIERMLKFCDRHQIGAQVEVFAMKDVNAAIDRLRENKARYRIVLRNEV